LGADHDAGAPRSNFRHAADATVIGGLHGPKQKVLRLVRGATMAQCWHATGQQRGGGPRILTNS